MHIGGRGSPVATRRGRRHARVSAAETGNDRGERAARLPRFVNRSGNRLESLCTQKCEQRGCGAVVAHHLAKVRVASSNLVIRSDQDREQARYLFFWWRTQKRWIGREARQRPAKPYTRVRIPYPPPGRESFSTWAIGAAVARFPDTEEVTGSIPVSPTTTRPRSSIGASFRLRVRLRLRP